MSQVDRNAKAINVANLTKAPEQISKIVQLSVSPPEVFAVISDHANLKEIVPGIESITIDQSESTEDNGKGTIRMVDLGDMGVLKERIVYWEPPLAYAYSIEGPLAAEDSLGLMICEDDSRGGTRFIWKQYFNHPEVEMVVDQISPLMEATLQNLIHHFKR